ncbi:hypothetical protein LF845_10485 [Deferribacterales bacterium Es71-Z0220]|jgi:hypothetical protein|uniref:hypothetical protein n=1 Tax=Deferrivibrio essentukiensis TaxID=2880922 RepID=UPI001F60E1C1|nr:hypothetical protein [Deferrivibrio essentukiensis]MBZ4672313.1 hypothetical protein [Deferribacteraceae bacterium]MCB4205381.1 hypothetical protein [Deferrivibrio essentukiensis]
MDNILFPTIAVIGNTGNNSRLKSEVRKKFRFNGKVIHIRPGRVDENGKSTLVITTELSLKELESLKGKEVIIIAE